jgi:hypothetical protein
VILANPRYTGRQVWNKQRKDEVLIDVEDVALGHTTKMRRNVWGFRTRPLVLTWALCGSLVFADEAAEDMRSLDSGGRVVGPGRME